MRGRTARHEDGAGKRTGILTRRPVVASELSDVFCALVEFLLAAFDVAFPGVEIWATGWGVVKGVGVEGVRRREWVLGVLGCGG